MCYLTTRQKEARPDQWILTRWESVSNAFAHVSVLEKGGRLCYTHMDLAAVPTPSTAGFVLRCLVLLQLQNAHILCLGSEVTGCGQMPCVSWGYGKPRKVFVLRRRCDFF